MAPVIHFPFSWNLYTCSGSKAALVIASRASAPRTEQSNQVVAQPGLRAHLWAGLQLTRQILQLCANLLARGLLVGTGAQRLDVLTPSSGQHPGHCLRERPPCMQARVGGQHQLRHSLACALCQHTRPLQASRMPDLPMAILQPPHMHHAAAHSATAATGHGLARTLKKVHVSLALLNEVGLLNLTCRRARHDITPQGRDPSPLTNAQLTAAWRHQRGPDYRPRLHASCLHACRLQRCCAMHARLPEAAAKRHNALHRSRRGVGQ